MNKLSSISIVPYISVYIYIHKLSRAAPMFNLRSAGVDHGLWQLVSIAFQVETFNVKNRLS